MLVNKIQRVITPKQHHTNSFCKLTLSAVAAAIEMGAPTVIVPKKPKPIIPYLFQIFKMIGYFSSGDFVGFFLCSKAFILSPKKVAAKTPANPPTKLAIRIVTGDNPNANPAGMAA